MKTKSISSSWMDREGRRLDCGPYMSGALEAKLALERLDAPKEPLSMLTANGTAGIFNGPRFARAYVDDPAFGIPFLGSTDILNASLTSLSRISKKQVTRNPRLVVQPTWTLITCSGTVGRMAYARPDMAGMAGSQHFMRVVPDTQRIPPGYLYAFLSSRFGVPLVAGGTYGAIIQHIEPEHIANIPVPRLGNALEAEIHRLVEQAATLRSEAAQLLAESITAMETTAGLSNLSVPASPSPFDISTVSSVVLQSRLDGFFYSRFHAAALHSLSCVQTIAIDDLAKRVSEPARFKRVKIDDERFGVPMFGTSALFWADPVASYHISRRMPNISTYLVDNKCLLIPRSGQLSGIIGSVVLPHGDVVGAAVSEDAIRIHCDTDIDAGYCFIALSSEYGRRQLKARAFGSSIPHLDVKHIGRVRIPDLGEQQRVILGEKGARVGQLRNDACKRERRARQLIETCIEEDSR